VTLKVAYPSSLADHVDGPSLRDTNEVVNRMGKGNKLQTSRSRRAPSPPGCTAGKCLVWFGPTAELATHTGEWLVFSPSEVLNIPLLQASLAHPTHPRTP
jgi:hypothetical protein